MNIKPLFDRVLLEPEKNSNQTQSGIMLPEAVQEKSHIAIVKAIGEGGTFDGKESKIQVAIGDRVIYNKFAGTEIKFDGEEYIIIRQTDILCILPQ